MSAPIDLITLDPTGELLDTMRQNSSIALAEVENRWRETTHPKLILAYLSALESYSPDYVDESIASNRRSAFITGGKLAVDAVWRGRSSLVTVPFESILTRFTDKLRDTQLGVDKAQEEVTHIMHDGMPEINPYDLGLTSHYQSIANLRPYAVDAETGLVISMRGLYDAHKELMELGVYSGTDIGEAWILFNGDDEATIEQ